MEKVEHDVKMIKTFFNTLLGLFRNKGDNLLAEATSWSWIEGEVDRSKKYFKLTYGDIEEPNDTWVDIAYVDYPEDGNFTVEFILKDPKNQQESMMIDATKRDLDYHIVERKLPNPARYMEAYCGMTANFYSKIHWSDFNTRKPKSRLSSLFPSLG